MASPDEEPNIGDFGTSSDLNCNYYTLDEYCSTSKDGISFFNFNMRSFHSNGLLFEVFLNSLPCLPEILLTTETWNNSNNHNLCFFDNYSGFHSYRIGSGRGGGVSIFCLDDYHAIKLDNACIINDDIETCAIRVKINNLSLTILGVYRPPSGHKGNFIITLESIIYSGVLNSDFIIVSGDMNINLLQDSDDVKNYNSMLRSMNFLSVITEPTRFPPGNHQNISPSILDHTWVCKNIISRAGIINIDISDHLPTFIHFNFPISEESLRTIKFRPFTESNLELLTRKIAAADWHSFLNFSNVNEACIAFITFLDKIYCESFPVKIKNLSGKRVKNGWMSGKLKRLINLKPEYFRLYRRGSVTREANDIIKNCVNKEVKNAKEIYHEKLFDGTRSDMKKNWDIIRKLSGISNKNPDIYLKENETLITDKNDVAQKFIDYFSGVATSLESGLGSSSGSPMETIPYSMRSLFLRPVSEAEIIKIISKLKNSKTDLNSMPAKIFKAVSLHLAFPISELVNHSFSHGIFPSHLKLARVTPIFKTGSKYDPANYRPISSLHYISKIFEKCMTKRIISYFDRFSLFSKSQFGFLSGKSTVDALIDLTENIFNSLDNREHHISILIDLKRAFDTVNHKLLLGKLERYGIRDLPLQWLKSYLSNRESYVGMGPASSRKVVSNIGVPQGSTIGPVLFLIYINDLPACCPRLSTTLFADDTTISYSHKNSNDLISIVNYELNLVKEWINANRLTLNVGKTECILFSNRNLEPIHNHVTLDNTSLSFSSKCKFLGVILDTKLNYSNHIDQVLGRLTNSARILYNIKNYLPLKSRLNLYFAFVFFRTIL